MNRYALLWSITLALLLLCPTSGRGDPIPDRRVVVAANLQTGVLHCAGGPCKGANAMIGGTLRSAYILDVPIAPGMEISTLVHPGAEFISQTMFTMGMQAFIRHVWLWGGMGIGHTMHRTTVAGEQQQHGEAAAGFVLELGYQVYQQPLFAIDVQLRATRLLYFDSADMKSQIYAAGIGFSWF